MKKSIISLVMLGVVMVAPVAFAQLQGPPGGVTLPNSQNSPLANPGSLGNTVCTVLDYMFYALIVLAIVFVLIAAFKYLTAQGDPEKVKVASKTLIYAAVAVAVGLIARAVPVFVGMFIGAGGSVGTNIGC